MSKQNYQNVMVQTLQQFPVGSKVKIAQSCKQPAVRYYDFTGVEEERAKFLVEQTFTVKGYHFFVIPGGQMDARLVVQYKNGNALENIDTWSSSHFEIL